MWCRANLMNLFCPRFDRSHSIKVHAHKGRPVYYIAVHKVGINLRRFRVFLIKNGMNRRLLLIHCLHFINFFLPLRVCEASKRKLMGKKLIKELFSGSHFLPPRASSCKAMGLIILRIIYTSHSKNCPRSWNCRMPARKNGTKDDTPIWQAISPQIGEQIELDRMATHRKVISQIKYRLFRKDSRSKEKSIMSCDHQKNRPSSTEYAPVQFFNYFYLFCTICFRFSDWSSVNQTFDNCDSLPMRWSEGPN